MDLISRGSGQSFNPKPRLPYVSSGGSFDDTSVPPKSEWKTDPNYWSNYQSNPDEWKKKKQKELETCSIPKGIQNKGGRNELSDSSRFIYNLDTKSAKK